MPDFERITPALYGIAYDIAPEVTKAKWDDWIVPILNKEAEIYKLAFRSYVFVRDEHRNKADGLEFFLITMKWIGLHVLDENQIVFRAVFSKYWDMAQSIVYWSSNEAQYDKHIPFNKALENWKQTNETLIDNCREDLKYWLNET